MKEAPAFVSAALPGVYIADSSLKGHTDRESTGWPGTEVPGFRHNRRMQ